MAFDEKVGKSRNTFKKKKKKVGIRNKVGLIQQSSGLKWYLLTNQTLENISSKYCQVYFYKMRKAFIILC